MPQTPDPKQQAALDKAAAEAKEKADAEAQRLADLEADAQKAAEQAEDFGAPRAARCPVDGCRERLERYTGSNPHKVGTHVCPTHGRLRLS